MSNYADVLVEEYLPKIIDIIIFNNIESLDIIAEDIDGCLQELAEDSTIQKYEMPRESVQAVINNLKNCSEIHSNNYYKVSRFLRQHNLSLDDCLEIIHNLKVEDYYKNTRSINNEFAANNLIIFEPTVIRLRDGREFNNLVIYLKIDLDSTTNEAVALVSIHDGTENTLPYRN